MKILHYAILQLITNKRCVKAVNWVKTIEINNCRFGVIGNIVHYLLLWEVESDVLEKLVE